MGGLGGSGPEELAASGNGAKEVSHLHRGAPRVPDVADVVETAVAYGDLGPGSRPLLAGPKDQLGDGGDGRERLSAEAVCGDGLEVVQGPELGGGVALQGQLGIPAAHAAAVVADTDEPGAALFDLDVNAAGPGVQGVFDQLLHDGPRPLDDLAGRDLVDQVLWKALDDAQGPPPHRREMEGARRALARRAPERISRRPASRAGPAPPPDARWARGRASRTRS